MSHLGRNLMEEEKQIIKKITTEYSTVYAGLMISDKVEMQSI